MEEEGMIDQSGFKTEELSMDFLEMWGLFVDLVKALDTVPRVALFAVLRLYGLPISFVNIII
jgi:hypothetical protein